MADAKILIVDDEKSILDLVSSYLKPEGYQVSTAFDGPSGLKAARAFKPDIVVLDVMLPGMDGLEVLTQIRRESAAYVIMLTAKADEIRQGLALQGRCYRVRARGEEEHPPKSTLSKIRGYQSPHTEPQTRKDQTHRPVADGICNNADDSEPAEPELTLQQRLRHGRHALEWEHQRTGPQDRHKAFEAKEGSKSRRK